MESYRLFKGDNFIVPPCRRLLSLLGFVHNWPTSRWSATKKENRFSLNGNGIISSFQGRQFYCSTLQKAPIALGICTQLANQQMVCNKKRKPVFIKRKWNHVVFSRATILLFHPVEGSYRSWDLYTTGQLVDGLQQKKENRFSLNGNGIISSFQGRQFYCSTLQKAPIALGICTQLANQQMVCNKKRKPVFIKRKWNHIVFSRATILLFHPVEGCYRSWDLYTTGQLVDGLQQKKKTGFH